MICPHCQTQLNEEQRYCPKCGTEVQDTKVEKKEEEQDFMKENELEEHTVLEDIEKDPLIIEPTLNNDEQPVILDTSNSASLDEEKENTVKIYTTSFFNYIKQGLKAPFTSTISVTEKEFPFSLTLFLLTILILPCTIYLFFSQLLHTTGIFYLDTLMSLLPFWKTTTAIFFIVVFIQVSFILLFIGIVKIQRSKTTVKLLFIRYMHISMLSLIGYIIGFFLAFINSPLAILLILGCWLFQIIVVSLLFFIERRENNTLIDPVYNVLLFLLGIYFIASVILPALIIS
ncbi:MAG: zinc-ribbon domain-containing protein [Bacillaceae bacterium]